MQVEVIRRTLGVTRALRDHMGARLAELLVRFRGQVRRVTILLADRNGPRGGIDKECRLVVHLRRGGAVVAEARDAVADVAVDRAAHRARQLLARFFSRWRAGRRVDTAALAPTVS